MSREPRAGAPRFEAVFRAEWGRVVAALVRWTGDVDRAEEYAQEALVAALERWPATGVPERPGAWLLTAARNRAVDQQRRRRRERERAAWLDPAETAPDAEEDAAVDPSGIPDDRLRLIFTCCHPALPREARVALTLRLLGGLTTPEIAAALLTRESTVAQRIVRAKRAIRERRLPYRVPDAGELPRRLPAVLDVVYLIFNEGYLARQGESLVRATLCDEALRLARLLAEQVPEASEARGLLALLELQAARQAARSDAAGGLVLLEDQDRSRWDRVRIERARGVLARALALGDPGPYALQAAIAECHAVAATFADTDWRRIAGLYAALARLTHSPVVELNRAVAIAMLEGPAAALTLVDALEGDPRLAAYAPLPATRADLLRRLGRRAEAVRAYRRALELSANEAERAFLSRRLAECGEGGETG